MTFSVPHPRNMNNSMYEYHRNERPVYATSTTSRSLMSHYSSNYFTTISHNGSEIYGDSSNHAHNVSNGWHSLGSTGPFKIKSVYPDDNETAFRTSALRSSPVASQPKFHLVRRSSMHAPHVEAPKLDQLKVDVYSAGVIMESRITGAFDPDLFKVEAVAPTGRIIRVTGDGNYAAQFNSDELGRWKVAMFYKGKYKDGCSLDVCDPSQVKVLDLKGGLVGKNNTFHVDCSKAGPGELGVDITHNGRPVTANISPTDSHGYKRISFTPHAPGAYEINVHFNRAEVREGDVEFFNPDERQRKAVFVTRVEPHHGYIDVKVTCDWEVEYITGWPFVCHVTDSSDIAVYGMEDGTVCAYPEMIADCTRAGDGRIDAYVSYNGQKYSCTVMKDKPLVYRIQFKPHGPGIYKVFINYDGRPVKGSPFIQEIAELEKPTANGDGLYHGALGKPVNFIVDPRGFPGQVSVSVHSPSKSVNCQLETLANNTIRATYHPTERGPHTVHIRIDGKDIEGSPYSPLIVDPVSVRVSGGWRPFLDETGIIPLRVNKEKHLPFDVSDAGAGELTSEVQGPHGKVAVTIDARTDGKHSVIFTPREEGKHYIHVKWSGYPLSNSPYLGYATIEPELTEPDSIRLFQVPIQSPDRYPRAVDNWPNEGPHGNSVNGKPKYFRPVEVISSSQNSRTDSAPDWTRTKVQVLPVHTGTSYSEPRYAESTSPRSFSPLTQQYYHQPVRVTLTPPEEGLTPQDEVDRPARVISTPHWTNSRVQVLPVQKNSFDEPRFLESSSPKLQSPTASPRSQPESTNGPQKIILSGKGLKEATVDKMAYFTVDGTRAEPGKPVAHLQGMDDSIPVAYEIKKPHVYKCSYMPKSPGVYLLNIGWNDKPLKGSPFKVNIQGVGKLEKVMPGNAPGHGILGKEWEMKIDSKFTKKGKLQVKCTDPLGKDVVCKLSDNNDGTRTLKIKPKMAGRYIVEILYNGEHVSGSPYAVDIREFHGTEPVRVWGPGIENGVIPHFQSDFWVDTTGAGAGEIRVRIMGPKGAFHVKIRKASQQDKVYLCQYDPVEPGIYTIFIQWSGVNARGSPFIVLLANTARDLQRMLEEVQDNSIITGDDSSVITQRLSRKHPPREMSSDDVILY